MLLDSTKLNQFQELLRKYISREADMQQLTQLVSNLSNITGIDYNNSKRFGFSARKQLSLKQSFQKFAFLAQTFIMTAAEVSLLLLVFDDVH